MLFVTRVSYWHLCLSIVVGRLWETQSPVRCAKWDPTYNIMYAGSMCLQPRQLCYNIATNQSFAKWNRNKEKLHLFPVSSLFENFGKCLKASQNLQDQNDETWSVTFTGYRKRMRIIVFMTFSQEGTKQMKKIDAIFEIKMVKLINRYKLYSNDEIHDLCVARGSGRRAEFFWLLVNKRSIGLESQLSTIDQKAILVYYPSD